MKLILALMLTVSNILLGGGELLAEQKETLPAIYIAGPLFTVAERQFNVALAKELRNLGYAVFLPQEGEPRELTAQAIFEMDVNGILQSQAVVAIFEGPDLDSGTCWECGYAYAKGIPIIAVRTDFRNPTDGGLAPYNIMLAASASKHVHLSSLEHDFQVVVTSIHQQLQECLKNL